ncbi:Sjoegren syndrome nuclear autoantigen 1 [Echinococcus multilocularis]|uniref:Sjoegren syndrome nuclear autoantigen 1 n=1 Tax=Echinococcus multilocularis TaxID=6211 RepID=A0A0S4MIM0_ECHMU|nr:Sjoegren syndrome nuclear autoantigen 1 [Echinococcus multilocularis]
MLKFLVYLVFFSTEQAQPLMDENETLAKAIEQLYEDKETIAKRQDLQEEVAQETQRLARMGQLLHEEVDGSSLARKRWIVGSNHLVEGLVSPVDAHEEALQNYIEQFHKALRGDPDEFLG